jgi:phage gpG-like protein
MPRGAARGSGSSVRVEIEGLREFMRDLKKLDPAVNKQFRVRLRTAVGEVIKDAQRRAPKRSGKLARLIKPSVTNKGAALSSKAAHARIHEFGGRHKVFGHSDRWVFQPAQPHIFPAVRAGHQEVARASLQALDDAMREVGFK